MTIETLIPIHVQQLKPFQKKQLPDQWQIAMNLDTHTKRHISYVYVLDTPNSQEVIGSVAFDKTNEVRYYKKDGKIQMVEEPHWELAIHMHNRDDMTSYGQYGITAAGLLAVLREVDKTGVNDLLIRTDETNVAMLKLGQKMGGLPYQELLNSADKNKPVVLVLTGGRVFDITIQKSIESLQKYKSWEFGVQVLSQVQGR